MKICRHFFILLLLGLPHALCAAQVTLSASTQTATIAEHVELRLIARTLEAIDEIRVSLPAGDYELISRKDQPLIQTAEWRTFEQVITIAFFKTGDFTIGPVTIELLAAKTVKEKESSATVTIKIRSLLEDRDKDIRPLKKLQDIKGSPMHVLKYAAGVVLLLLLGLLLLMLKRKLRKKPRAADAPLPAPEIELETRIRELWRKKLPQQGEYKLFFIQLGEILKNFLARTYRFNADDFTTTETMARLKSCETDSQIIACLQDVFRQADLVKFAKRVPETAAIDSLAEKIASLIDTYKQRRKLETEAHHVPAGY